MLCLSWLMAAALLCCSSLYVDGRCLNVNNCMGLESNEEMLDCIRQCRSEQDFSNFESVSSSQQQGNEEEVEEESLSLGLLLSALSPDSTQIQAPESPHSEDRRSYSMEHFRWGKPIGRKRRPVKVFSTNSAAEEEPEESVEASLPSQIRPQLGVRVERGQGAVLDVQQRNNVKSNGKYRMTHFRWSAPPATKRYGGFMKSFSDQSHMPLLSLLRNVIAKDVRQFRE